MNCPICNNEMEQGFLQGIKRVAWVKKHHKISLLPKQGEILLENNVVKDFIFLAWICKKCKKVVVDYSDKETQEG
ncbi:PF20097 family protein [Tissierella sp.]|uniref:PF20097 family protein n=1 Tax=Tissierella sp. TaxID=41274 RepID=UPI0028AAAF6F|nr:PF20097 family protein [Tissierella sp.]